MARTSRKLEHLKFANEILQESTTGFNNVHFVHQALSEVSFDKTSISTTVGGLNLSSPIIINAMTGGAYETTRINEQLAIIARETGLAIAVGSQMSALRNKEYIPSYQVVRKNNPNGIIFANLGAEAVVEQALEAIEMVEADALQVHLNVVQELVMPEGERTFEGTLDRIQQIKESIKIPLIIKEVGFGISKETARKLMDIGISIIDIGGKGGTNFAVIENKRRKVPLSIFNDWGIATVSSLLEVKTIDNIEIIASGGIQDGLQIAKSIGLGASAVGMAGVILQSLMSKDVKGTLSLIENLHHQLRLIMTSLSAENLAELKAKPMVILGDLKDWCELRGISIIDLARRV